MKYAYIDIHYDNKVLRWLDTEAKNHVLPPEEYLRICTDEEFALSETGNEYMVKDGQIVPYVPPVVVPIVVVPRICTPAQGLVALYVLKGIEESAVVAAIDAIPDPIQRYTAKIGYQKATAWERGSQSMMLIAALLNLTETDLDELFTFAVTINV